MNNRSPPFLTPHYFVWKDSKECWPAVDSSENRASPCLPLGAAWYDTLNFEYPNLDFLVECTFSETLDILEAVDQHELYLSHFWIS